jgi:hypothetical protein
MKKIMISFIALVVAASGIYLMAADHIDAPAVGSLSTGSSAADITDYYAFESPENSDNYVFVTNVFGLTAPANTGEVSFDSNVMYEINIDNDGDNVEDLVIQTVFRYGKAIVFGPVAPGTPGLSSNIQNTGSRVTADITTVGNPPTIGTGNGIKVFAGPRDDPFFMDFFKFVDIVNGAGSALGLDVNPPANGDTYATSFDETGTDTFQGTNVLSVVIEVPKSSLGSSTTFSSWVESKVKN